MLCVGSAVPGLHLGVRWLAAQLVAAAACAPAPPAAGQVSSPEARPSPRGLPLGRLFPKTPAPEPAAPPAAFPWPSHPAPPPPPHPHPSRCSPSPAPPLLPIPLVPSTHPAPPTRPVAPPPHHHQPARRHTFLLGPGGTRRVLALVRRMLEDAKLEVREMAATTLSGGCRH